MDPDVIVIGAGAAGLAAAMRLAQRSLRVVVLEARDRIGGRVLWTDESDGRESVELGAEFIHGRAPETMALLRQAGASAAALDGASWTCGADGVLTDDKTDFREATDIFAGAQDLKADESVDRYLQRFDRDPSMAEKVVLARLFVKGFEAADPSDASVIAIADELRSGVDYATHRPTGGYRPLFAELHAACVKAGVAIELSAVVNAIKWRRGDVAIDATIGSQRRTLRAKATVVTVPVGVLKRAAEAAWFDPALSAEKRSALDKIEMGHVVKVVLRFRSPFWERVENGRFDGAGFFRCPDGRFPAYWTQRPLPGGSVVAWAGGTDASALDGLSPSDLVETALDEFSGLFGHPHAVREEFLDGVMHDWSSDPFSWGAYSYVVVNGHGARAALGAPVENTLFFAGEAASTDGQGGTVNGAISTGERAAREAAASLEAEAR
ncbi:MAG TPA: NAD(P)/FAD-dependent oxidoreductase [Candidatus Eremiobacteraceae bacterium]|nr:NAD(P)/FAD-dependent oxidoreductase [Candidatus Eremiobacteraceae bacterium]